MPDPKLKAKKKLTMAQKTNGAMSPGKKLLKKKPVLPPVKKKKPVVKKTMTPAQRKKLALLVSGNKTKK